MLFFTYLCSFQSRTPGWNKYCSPEYPDLIRYLDAHLKTVLLKSHNGIDCGIDFVNFLALNARVLESMTVVVDPKNAEYLAKKREKLQLDNRTSSRAQFHFTTEDNKKWIITNVRDLYLVDP